MELSEQDQQCVLDTAAENLTRSLRQDAKDLLAEQMRTLLSDVFDEEMRELARVAIEPTVAQIVAGGWPSTNNYGERTGASLSLRDRLSKEIVKTKAYSSDKGILTTLVVKYIAKELDPVMKELTAKVRKAVDSHITATLNDTLKRALGMNPRD